MTDLNLNERIQQDLDALGWGTAVSAAGFAVTDSLPNRKKQLYADVHLPVIREMFSKHDRHGQVPSGSFAEGNDHASGFNLVALQTGKIPPLRVAMSGFGQKHGLRSVTRENLPELLAEFSAILSNDLVEHGVPSTPARILSLCAFRYARGMGETVNAAHSPLPELVYEYIAADVEPNILLLNFSKRLNPYHVGNGRFITPPIPLMDAKKLGRVPAQMLEDLYVTKLEF